MLMRRTTGLLLAATLVVFGGLMTVAPAASATSYSAYAWGYNGFGELGNGTPLVRTPVLTTIHVGQRRRR